MLKGRQNLEFVTRKTQKKDRQAGHPDRQRSSHATYCPGNSRRTKPLCIRGTKVTNFQKPFRTGLYDFMIIMETFKGPFVNFALNPDIINKI